ncbi:MAG: sulfurtransferase-like selenium metabolism protein YedF [Desulfuromonadales bacterium]|nr:sulfurtransferase-like selenium metabolism protein YedF [Desulfuromonadales bacterium]
MNTLDCRALKCPHPVVEARKQLLDAPGHPLQILVGDEVARENISRMAASMGYTTMAEIIEGGFSLTLSPGAAAAEAAGQAPVQGKTVIYIDSDQMGQGNEELGRVLMKNYLLTLTELTTLPDQMLFVNNGAKLVCKGSDALEALNTLACNGVDIATCGLCLEYFELKEDLQVGRITNMLEVAEVHQQAGRLIKP